MCQGEAAVVVQSVHQAPECPLDIPAVQLPEAQVVEPQRRAVVAGLVLSGFRLQAQCPLGFGQYRVASFHVFDRGRLSEQGHLMFFSYANCPLVPGLGYLLSRAFWSLPYL